MFGSSSFGGQYFAQPAAVVAATVSPAGITSGSAVGTPSVTPGAVTLSPAGISSVAALGTPTVTRGPVTLSPAGIASGQAVGTPTVTPGTATVSPAGIGSGQTFGTPAVGSVGTVAPAGIGSGQAVGTPTVTPGAVILSPFGVPAAGAVGTPSVTTAYTISPAGIGSGQAFGTARFTLYLLPAGIGSGEAFGTAEVAHVTGALRPPSIETGYAVGTPTVLAETLGPPVADPAGTDSGFGGSELVVPAISLVPSRRAQPAFFRIKLTSLHYPPNTTDGIAGRRAKTLALVQDFRDAEVVIPINDARTASVVISMDDPACDHVTPYSTLLHVVYVTPTHRHLVFWGVLVQPEWDSAGETVKLNAVDMSLRMSHDYVRWGDQILNGNDAPGTFTAFGTTVDYLPNVHNTAGWKRSTGKVPLDYVGIRMLRDAADTEAYQRARGVPPLGIMNGTNDAAALPDNTPHVMEVQRGDEVFQKMKDLNAHGAHNDFPGAPDFELQPYDKAGGYYAKLNTFIRQGSPDPSRLLFHDGFGEDNCTINYTPGSKIINAAHVLSTGNQKRVTVVDIASTALYGIYHEWDSTEIPAAATDALYERAQQTVDAYGTPPDYFTTSPNVDLGLYYKDHLNVGDAMTAAVRRGRLVRSMLADIVSVTLKQIDAAGNVTTGLDSRIVVGSTTEDAPPREHQ